MTAHLVTLLIIPPSFTLNLTEPYCLSFDKKCSTLTVLFLDRESRNISRSAKFLLLMLLLYCCSCCCCCCKLLHIRIPASHIAYVLYIRKLFSTTPLLILEVFYSVKNVKVNSHLTSAQACKCAAWIGPTQTIESNLLQQIICRFIFSCLFGSYM